MLTLFELADEVLQFAELVYRNSLNQSLQIAQTVKIRVMCVFCFQLADALL
ncbi:hypothetical protein D3C71_1881000 [compost metagenome]